MAGIAVAERGIGGNFVPRVISRVASRRLKSGLSGRMTPRTHSFEFNASRARQVPIFPRQDRTRVERV